MKVLLCGGCGFIGSFIAKELIESGDEVVCYDSLVNYIDPFRTNYTKQLLFRLDMIKDKAKIIRGDIRNKGHVSKIIREEQPDIVVNLAALSSDVLADSMAEEAIQVNLMGVVNVLDACVENNVKRFVYTSSSTVYGDFQYVPCDEEHPKNPKSMYAGTKYMGEILTKVYANRFGLNYTIIRPSAVYGPTEQNKRVSQMFVEFAFEGKTLRLDGGGMNTLDFSYVKDVAHGFVLAMKSDKAENEIFNITTGNGRKLKEYAEILKKYFPNITTEEKPLDKLRPVRGTLCIDKARKLLGFEPKYQIEDGIAEYIEWVKNNGQINKV